jgi:hypothetical protein
MSISDLSNSPLEFNLGKKSVKVSRLSIKEFFGIAENKVKQNFINNMQSVASFLNGKEKIEYLIQTTKDIPTGDKLFELTQIWIKTNEGMSELLKVALNKHQTLTEEEITTLILQADIGQIEAMVNFIAGVENESGVQNTDEKKV